MPPDFEIDWEPLESLLDMAMAFDDIDDDIGGITYDWWDSDGISRFFLMESDDE